MSGYPVLVGQDDDGPLQYLLRQMRLPKPQPKPKRSAPRKQNWLERVSMEGRYLVLNAKWRYLRPLSNGFAGKDLAREIELGCIENGLKIRRADHISKLVKGLSRQVIEQTQTIGGMTTFDD